MITKEDMVAFEYYEQLELNLGDNHEEDPRDKTPLQMVKEYAKTAGQKPDASRAIRLVKEEYIEWEDANTYEELLKETADLVYVLYGFANTMGWDLDQALWRVHDNNMERMFQDDGTIKRREDGKILRNKNYPDVDLKDLV